MKKKIVSKKAVTPKKEKNGYVTRSELAMLLKEQTKEIARSTDASMKEQAVEIARSTDARLKEQTKEIARNMGALSEEFQSRTSAIAEQFSGLNEKINLNTEMIGTLMVDMTEVKEKVDILTEDMTEVKETLNKHSGKLDSLSSDVSVMKDNIEIIKTDVKKKVDHEEFSMLERRVSYIESKIKVL
jgi:chromosome segregation ATPase